MLAIVIITLRNWKWLSKLEIYLNNYRICAIQITPRDGNISKLVFSHRKPLLKYGDISRVYLHLFFYKVI